MSHLGGRLATLIVFGAVVVLVGQLSLCHCSAISLAPSVLVDSDGIVGLDLAQLHNLSSSHLSELNALVGHAHNSELRFAPEDAHRSSSSSSSGHRRRMERDVSVYTRVYYIETMVYVDKSLIDRFPGNERELKRLVLGILYQTQLIYNFDSLKIRIHIAVKKIVYLKDGREAPNSAGGNIDHYLDNFCEWQQKQMTKARKKQRWDHALLLTGLNLYKQIGHQRNNKVLGLAWVNGMCKPAYSCTINEAKNFEAAYVIAHEMAHSLGVMHDGNGNTCDSNTNIMSDRTGAGKIHWSQCSNMYLEDFLTKLGKDNCLDNFPIEGGSSSTTKRVDEVALANDKLPGQQFDLNKQCQLALSEQFKAYATSTAPFNNVCSELWCANARHAVPAHPALEGSACGTAGICYQGKCVPLSRLNQHNGLATFRDRHRVSDAPSTASSSSSSAAAGGKNATDKFGGGHSSSTTNSAHRGGGQNFMRNVQGFLRSTVRAFRQFFGR